MNELHKMFGVVDSKNLLSIFMHIDQIHSIFSENKFFSCEREQLILGNSWCVKIIEYVLINVSNRQHICQFFLEIILHY